MKVRQAFLPVAVARFASVRLSKATPPMPRIRISKFYRKGAAPRVMKKADEPAVPPPPPSPQESVTERFLREAAVRHPVQQSLGGTEGQ